MEPATRSSTPGARCRQRWRGRRKRCPADDSCPRTVADPGARLSHYCSLHYSTDYSYFTPTRLVVLTELSLQVLLAIGDGPLHGYAIGKDIEARTLGRLDPTTGALYQVIKRLTQDGLLKPVAAPSRGEVDARRKHFAITPAGRKAVLEEIERLDKLVSLARSRRLYPARA